MLTADDQWLEVRGSWCRCELKDRERERETGRRRGRVREQERESPRFIFPHLTTHNWSVIFLPLALTTLSEYWSDALMQTCQINFVRRKLWLLQNCLGNSAGGCGLPMNFNHHVNGARTIQSLSPSHSLHRYRQGRKTLFKSALF